MSDLPKALAQLEEVMIRATIAETGGNRTEDEHENFSYITCFIDIGNVFHARRTS